MSTKEYWGLDEDDDEMPEVKWDICRQGRAWGPGEAHARYELSPEKIEMIKAKLFWSERDRLVMLALLLENVGVDKAVRLGDPAVWREALEHLREARGNA